MIGRIEQGTKRADLAGGWFWLVVGWRFQVLLAGDGFLAAVNTSGYSGTVTPESLVADRLEEMRITARRLADTLMRSPALRRSLLPG